MNQTLTANQASHAPAGETTANLGRFTPIGLLLGIVGTVALIVLYISGNPVGATGGWLFGWYFWFTLTMGMFGLSILHHTLRPSWSLPFLRLWEAGGGPASLALMALLFLPIFAHPVTLYEWADPATVAQHAQLRFKVPYLNFPFWAGRLVFYFVIWIVYASFMKKSERTQETTGEFALEKGRSSWGAVGMVMFFVTYTFAVLDVLMSLEATWSSTMMPLWQTIASCLGAASFSVAVACVNARKEPYTRVIGPNLTKDWGNILFMFTMLWAYTAISQFLIIWNGNLPETTQYYARRAANDWNAIGMVTILGQFLVPWMTLLSPRVKRYPRLLRQIAGWIFCIHIVDCYLAVAPALPGKAAEGAMQFHAAGVLTNLIFCVAGFCAVGGFWLAVFGAQASKAPLLVGYDQRLQEALVHAH